MAIRTFELTGPATFHKRGLTNFPIKRGETLEFDDSIPAHAEIIEKIMAEGSYVPQPAGVEILDEDFRPYFRETTSDRRGAARARRENLDEAPRPIIAADIAGEAGDEPAGQGGSEEQAAAAKPQRGRRAVAQKVD